MYLTKNRYGAMVVLSIEGEGYSNLIGDVEMKLDEADKAASVSEKRLSHNAAFRKGLKTDICDNVIDNRREIR